MDLFDKKPVDLKTQAVTTLEEATAVAKEVAEISKQLNAVATAYDTELKALEVSAKAIKDRFEAMMKPLREELAIYNEKLTKYHMDTLGAATPEEQEKLKSIKLPYGVTLASRASAPTLKVKEDEASKKLYLEKARELGLTKEDVKWADMKKGIEIKGGKAVLAETGEILDFLQIDEKERAYDVKWK